VSADGYPLDEERDHGFLLQDPDDMATDEECESHLGKLPRHHPLIKDGVSDEGMR